MQNKLITLDEIIWEITGACLNKCKYCGSSANWNDPISEIEIIEICDAIAKFPPKSINISGGDPTLISYYTHKIITNTLKTSQPKIIINPKSYLRLKSEKLSLREILDLYYWTGISINSQDELDAFLKYWNSFEHSYNEKCPITIISNFNLINLFLFDKIQKLVKDLNVIWQIQLTMYHNKTNELALYNPNNNEAWNHFEKKITSAFKEKVKIILADNINSGKCTAGSQSLGILSNGNVIPCLSMRSWHSNINTVYQGNLFKDSLKNIWIENFKNYRFENFECCKDHCNNKCFTIDKTRNSPKSIFEDFIIQKQEDDKIYKPEKCQPPAIYVYGVTTPITMLYGVQDTPSIT
jgi:MoaA/NifB/PqqE/SkfB family radical SAM enzyme